MDLSSDYYSEWISMDFSIKRMNKCGFKYLKLMDLSISSELSMDLSYKTKEWI